MQTVDMHVHLLNPNLKFDRFYDKMALKLFGKKFWIDFNLVKINPYEAYIKALIDSIKKSKYVSKVVLLPVDSKFSKDGREIHRDKTVCSLSEDVLEIYNRDKDLIIPFLSVNPYRKNALELLEKYAFLGAKGAKFLQNYWEIDLNDKKLIPYYEKLKELKLPLIIHIGGEFSIKSNKYYQSYKMLKLPLDCKVTVIAAHMGVGEIKNNFLFWQYFSQNPKYFNEDYTEILKMLRVYDNLYADISALLTLPKSRVLRDLSTQNVEDKLLFATDYPVVYSTIFAGYDLSFKKRFELNKIENPFDRYTQTILEYFPKSSPIFTNYKKLNLF